MENSLCLEGFILLRRLFTDVVANYFMFDMSWIKHCLALQGAVKRLLMNRILTCGVRKD